MDNLLIVSACSYAGAPGPAYRPHLDLAYHVRFDAWVSSSDESGVLPNETLAGGPLYDPVFVERQMGSRAAELETRLGPVARLAALDQQGVAAEILFPDFRRGLRAPFNAVHGRIDGQADLEHAGIRAYNRWLATYCAANPKRLIGIAVLPLGASGNSSSVAASVSELEWAKKAGLGGVLVRTVPAELVRNGLPRLGAADPSAEPVWEACEALDMPVHTLGGISLHLAADVPGSPLIYHYQWAETANNLLGLFVLGGILDRHPRLRLVLADQGTRRIVDLLDGWEMTYESPTFDSGYYSMSRRPWTYWARQCSTSPAPMRRRDCDLRAVLGVSRLMWSSRFPIPLGGWLDVTGELGPLFEQVSEYETRAIVGDNAVRVYGLDRAELGAVAAKIGPDFERLDRLANSNRAVIA